MANNRMYVRCRCGSQRFLAKRFVDGYYTLDDTATKLDDWFDEHAGCEGTQDHFDLVYELDPDWEPLKGKLASDET